MKRLTTEQEAICNAYDMLNDDDISTERLLQMVADHCDCDTGDVVDALKAARS